MTRKNHLLCRLFQPDMSLPGKLIYIAAVLLQLMIPVSANASGDGFAAPSQAEMEPDSVAYLLDELDVVATKHNAAFRSMPISGTIVRGDDADRLGIGDVKGLSSVVPNFYIPDYGSRITSTIYVRGIGARMDQPAVGLTIDNVSILNKDAYDFDIHDITYMEMLRGPQSALFGRNTMTGLVNIRTLSPMQYQGWRGLVELGPRQLFKFNLGWYHKFRHNFAASISGSFYRRNGEFKNEYDGCTVDKEVNGSLRIKFVWSPKENIHIANTLSQSLLRQGGYPYENVASGKISYNDTCFYKRYLLTDGLTVTGQFGDIKMVSVTSTQFIDDNMTLDQDFLPQSYFTLTQKKKEISLTEDLMFRGSSGSGMYSWLAGAFGFYRHLDMTAPVTFKDYGITHLIEEHRNKANPYYPIRWDESSFPLNSNFTLPSGGAALYHESRFDIDRIRIQAGIRLDYERICMDYHSWCNTSYTIYQNPSGELPMPSDCQTYRKERVDLDEIGNLSTHYFMVLPKLSILWDLPSMVASNLYITAGKGYKAGGYNTQMFSDVLQQELMRFMGIGGEYDVKDIVGYKPEKSWNYEIGGHFNLIDSKVSLDASVFYIDCHDQQMTVFPNGDTTGRMMTNAGKTRSIGMEISGYYTILTDLSIMATYGFTDARFIDFNDGLESYKGKRLPYAPSNTLFAEASYMFNVSKKLREHYFAVHLNFSGTGDIYWNEANTLHQKFYGLLGGTIGYHAPRWSVEIWGKNLTSTKYYTFYFKSIGNEFRQRGRGPDFGITVRARF